MSEREEHEEPDFHQMMIFGAVASTVVVSVFLGFWLFFILTAMQIQ